MSGVHLTTEEKLEGVRRAWPLWVGVITKAVVDKYGDEGCAVIKEALRNQGYIHGQKVFVEKKHFGSTLQDFVEGYVLETVVETLGYELESSESTESCVKFHVARCPLWERLKVIGVPEDMCEIWDSYQLGVREALNPSNPITHYHGKQLIKGDPYCELFWELGQG